MTLTIEQNPTTTEEFAERVFAAALGTIDIYALYVGDKLGLYAYLAEHGPLTSDELADGCQMHPRYAHEWLEQQATGGIVAVDDPSLHGEARRYHLHAGPAEVLTDPDSLSFLAPFVRMMATCGINLGSLLDAYRSGGGVSWQDFGPDMRTGQAEMNRPWFLNELGTTWFPAVPDLHQRLTEGGRVADVGRGEGWSSIAIALAYPGVTVDGYDIDADSMEAARRHAERSGVADRVTFQRADAAHLDPEEKYDVVTAFECIHDLSNPVEVLAAMNRLAAADGIVVVMDEAVGDTFGERTDEVERLMYGFSLFVCLPDGMSHQPSAGTGTVFRPDTLKRYAFGAGFESVEVLPIDNDLWRFYRLNR